MQQVGSRLKPIQCHGCSGHGMVSDYGNGEDFYGAKECSTCEGTGRLLLSPTGYLMVRPGRLAGRATSEEIKANFETAEAA